MSTDEINSLIDMEQVISPINNDATKDIDWTELAAGFSLNNTNLAHFETMFNSEMIQHLVNISKTKMDLHSQPELIPMSLQSFRVESIVMIADLIRSVLESRKTIADLPLTPEQAEPEQQASESQGDLKEQSDLEFRKSHKRPRRELTVKPIKPQPIKQQLGSKSKNFHLPPIATAALRDWFAAHWDHPFANNAEKVELQQLTGLSIQQVSNWLTNARKRTWRKKTKSQFENTCDESLDES
jgi:hypothetical protein